MGKNYWFILVNWKDVQVSNYLLMKPIVMTGKCAKVTQRSRPGLGRLQVQFLEYNRPKLLFTRRRPALLYYTERCCYRMLSYATTVELP